MSNSSKKNEIDSAKPSRPIKKDSVLYRILYEIAKKAAERLQNEDGKKSP